MSAPRGECAGEAAVSRGSPGALTRSVLAALCAPFPGAEIRFRPGLVVGGQAFALPFAGAAGVRARLDEVVGAEGWRFEAEVLCAECDRVMGCLTILGVTRRAVGQAGEGEGLEAAEARALAGCGELFGIGRYLRYLLPQRARYDAGADCWKPDPTLAPEAVACALAMADTGLLGVQPQLAVACPHVVPRAEPDAEEARATFLHAAARAGWPLRDGGEMERRVNRLLGRPPGDRRPPGGGEWLQAAAQLEARPRP